MPSDSNSVCLEDMEEQKLAIKRWLGTGSINLFGMPFAGKDTQGKRLAKWLNGEHISGGEILRHKAVSPIDQHALASGDLVPVEDYLSIVLPYLSRPEFQGKPLILSAVGHQNSEVESIIQAADTARHPIKAVIHLMINEEVAKERWEHLQQRDDRDHRIDDQPGILEHRLIEYYQKTQPLLNLYREKGLLLEVDGSGTPDEVEANVLDALYQRADLKLKS